MAKKTNKKTTAKKTNEISYEGNVTVSLVRGNKVIKSIKQHNSGNLPLFSFLASCLYGSFSLNNAPKYIIAGFIDAASPENPTELTSAIPYSSKALSTNTTNGSATVTYKFLIPFSQIQSGTEINYFRLYSSASADWAVDVHYADFTLSDEHTIESDGKSNIVLTWALTIKNK